MFNCVAIGCIIINKFQDDLFDGEPEAFMKRLQSLIKDIPYESQNESTYRSIVWLVCILSGMISDAERHSYLGRSDLEVKTPDNVYIFEFKYNGSADEGMKQIRDRDYAGRFAMDSRSVYLIAANFSDNAQSRGLTEWQICKLK